MIFFIFHTSNAASKQMETCTALNMSRIIFSLFWSARGHRLKDNLWREKLSSWPWLSSNQRPCCDVEVEFIFFLLVLAEFKTESIKNNRTDGSGDWTGWRIVSWTIWPWRPPPSPTQGGVIYQLHSSEHTWTLQRFIWWKLCCHVNKTSSEWNKKTDGHFKLKDNIRLKFGNIRFFSAHKVQQRRTSERGLIFWEKTQIKVVNSQDLTLNILRL